MRYLISRIAMLVPAALAITGEAAVLPDTGIITCYTDTAPDTVAPNEPTSVARDGGPFPRQDCRFGMDAGAVFGGFPKTGVGSRGFDYTKIANNGSVLAAQATLGSNPGDWACTRDNLTGLLWEVKTTSAASLRYSGHTYTWFDSNNSTNGGNAGTSTGNGCNGTLPACNTEAYRIAVNQAGLCGFTDWRMPSIRELFTLSHLGTSVPAVDIAYLPNTPPQALYFASTTSVGNVDAFVVLIQNGLTNSTAKSSSQSVRLVRGGPF